MSADNYIFVLRTPRPRGSTRMQMQDPISGIWRDVNSVEYEWRVKHVVGAYWESDVEIVAEFHDAKVFRSQLNAYQYAEELLGSMDYVEYGINPITLVFPYPATSDDGVWSDAASSNRQSDDHKLQVHDCRC